MIKRHPHLLCGEDTLLLVVDMQEPFLRGIRHPESLMREVTFLIEAARILEVPTLATAQYAERMGGIIPPLAKWLSASLIDKLTFSCAGNEQFMRTLTDSGRKQVLICGVETHICVSQTALDLLAAGYQVHVAADSVSARADSDHSLGLEKMRQAGVLLTSAEAAIYEMLYEAGTQRFKEVLRLIKERV